MAVVTNFEELEIWKLARTQAQAFFELYAKAPFGQDFELKNQINASTGSVMDCIAEGFERSGNKEFIHFLLIAKASNAEACSQLCRALDRKYILPAVFNELYQNNKALSAKIGNLIKYLKESTRRGFRHEP